MRKKENFGASIGDADDELVVSAAPVRVRQPATDIEQGHRSDQSL